MSITVTFCANLTQAGLPPPWRDSLFFLRPSKESVTNTRLGKGKYVNVRTNKFVKSTQKKQKQTPSTLYSTPPTEPRLQLLACQAGGDPSFMFEVVSCQDVSRYSTQSTLSMPCEAKPCTLIIPRNARCHDRDESAANSGIHCSKLGGGI